MKRTKIEFETILRLALTLNENVVITKPSGSVRFAIHVACDDNSRFFSQKEEIKKLFADNYSVTIWGNNHITLEEGRGFQSIM